MKNIRTILRDNNLSPRENILTLLKNYAHRNVTGKDILSEADIGALITNFKPKSIHEQDEYFKYKKM
jgi:hypothetical protein